MVTINMLQRQPEVGRYAVDFEISEGGFPEDLKVAIEKHIGKSGYCVFEGKNRTKLVVGSTVNYHPGPASAALELIRRRYPQATYTGGFQGNW